MAIAVVAGLASVGGAVASAIVAGTLSTFAFTTALTYFAVGAGLSMVSRALMPKPDIGTRLGGLQTTVKKPAMARQVIYGRAKVGGNIVYFDTTSSNNRYLHLVIAMAGHEIDAYEKVYFNDELVWDSGYVDDWQTYARIKFYKGDQTTADNDLVQESTAWTQAHKLLDTAYLYVRLEYDQDKFSDGVPNVSALIRGKKVLDPRTSTTAWSDNPALCVNDYLRDQKYGLNTTDILESSVIKSANDCDALVDYDDNGTTAQHERFKLNGVIDTSQRISTNIELMLTAMAGRVVFSGGLFEVHAGVYNTPTVTLDESVIVGDIKFATKQSRRSTYNGVKGVFLSEEQNYTLADYPAQVSSTYQAEDGEPLFLDMTLPFTTDNVRAQRIAKLALLKSRQQRTLVVPVNLAGLKLKAGDTVNITNTKLGLSNAPYEVLDYELSYSDNLTVNLSLIETASGYYDWNASDQLDFSVETDVSLYNGVPVAPTNLVTTAGTNIKTDGTATGYIDVSWTASDDAFVDHYIIEYSNGSDRQSIKSNDTAHRITTFNDGVSYSIKVYAVNLIGRKSEALSGSATSVIDTTPPSNITNVTAVGGLQQILVSWTNPSDDDFDLVRIKVADTNSQPANHTYEVRSNSYLHEALEFNKTKYYWLAPVDRTGNVGNYTSAVSATTDSFGVFYSDEFNYSNTGELNWTSYEGSGELSLVTGVGEYQGRVLRIGNASGNDQRTLITDSMFKYDPLKKYRVKARLRQTSGNGTVYIGVAGRNESGSQFVNTSGSNSYASQFYCSANAQDIDDTWTEVVGYISGESTSGFGYHPDYYDPSPLHPNVFNISPLIIVNYSGQAGTTEIDYIRLQEVDKDPIIDARTASSSFHTGGFGDIKFTPNRNQVGGYNVGEIRVQGSTFYHPNGNSYPITNNRAIWSPFEVASSPNGGLVTQETFFVIFSDIDVSARFDSTFPEFDIDAQSSYSQNFFIAIYDEYYNKWFAIDNFNNRKEITPFQSDCIVAIGSKSTYNIGIDNFVTLLNVGSDFAIIDQITSANATAFIGDSAVNTPMVVDNAISESATAQSASTAIAGFENFTNAVQTTITTTAGAKCVIGGQFRPNDNNDDLAIRIKRGSTLVYWFRTFDANKTNTFNVIDTPPAGTHTYEIEVENTSSVTKYMYDNFLYVLELKK